MSIGVIGRGFVGGSIEKFYNEFTGHDVFSYDKRDSIDSNKKIAEIVANCEVIYVAVPTPMGQGGECITSHVEEVLSIVNYHANDQKKIDWDRPVCLLKSTMVPGTTFELQKVFPWLDLVANPEFLTERNAYRDLINSPTHVIGVDEERDVNCRIRSMLTRLYRKGWPDARLILCSPTEAEMIKYQTNTYFSLKVSFANHMASLCRSMGINYAEYINKAINADPRIERTHWDVPGPDGQLGFGGKCFPKDLNGMMELFRRFDVPCPVLDAAWDCNKEIREEKDWLQIEGAVEPAGENS